MATAAIIADLEEGVAPWSKPWKTDGSGMMQIHLNGHRKEPYRGVNQVLLHIAAAKHDYQLPVWVTFKQAQEMGGTVNKGEKSPGYVVFWKRINVKDRDATEEGKTKSIPFASYSAVFNIEQTSVPREKYEALLPKPRTVIELQSHDRIADIEEFIAATGATFSEGGDRAYFHPTSDSIRVPEMGKFESAADYYSTVFHELIHWTSHESRCDRKLGGRFGDDAYAAEELVAEMGAAFMCAAHGLPGKLQHAEYIGHWIKVLKGDDRAIFTATNRAQAAVDYLLGTEAAEAKEAA
jgi:antirestriction protein ArdC